MARMTSWHEWTDFPLGLTMLSAVAVAVGLTVAVHLSPEPRARSSTVERSVLELEGASAKRYYQRAWSGARTMQMRDSLRALARPGVTILRDPRLSREQAERFEERLRAAWSPFSVARPRVPIVLAVSAVTKRHAARPFDDPIFTALPTGSGEPCIMMYRVPGSWRAVERDARMFRRSMFGCALFAQHGYPGPGVQEELRRIGWSPSPLQFQRRYWQFSPIQNTLGSIGPWFPVEGLMYIACSAGKLEACRDAASRPAVRSREYPPGIARGVRLFSDLSLLALLQASLPPADFDRLWRDERPFPVAVADITGKPIEAWAHQALLRTANPLESSFSPTAPLFGRALLFLLVAAAASVVMQVRRRVV